MPTKSDYPRPNSAGPYIECATCYDRIRSEYRHDWRPCKCGATYVDGGSAYLRVGGTPILTEEGQIATFEALA